MRTIKRAILKTVVILAGIVLFVTGTSCRKKSEKVSAGEIVKALENTFGVVPGHRRNHIKGTCAEGTFVGSPVMEDYSSSPLFSGKPVPVVARFSLAGGNPSVPDVAKSPRGMALQFDLPGGGHQNMTMLNSPVFGAATPRSFFDMIVAQRPDPSTGKPDPEKMQEFKKSHPDNAAQARFLAQNNPPDSFAHSSYFGIHTFKFVNAASKITLVKWRFVPRQGDVRLTDEDLKSMPKNFLEERLIRELKKGPAEWDMFVTIGKNDDVQDNPTVEWPRDRKEMQAGTLKITGATPEKGARCEIINYDPLVMGPGIAPTMDPVLQIRSAAYGISFGKRMPEMKEMKQ